MKKIKRAIKRYLLKRELEYWHHELCSLELVLEYTNVPCEGFEKEGCLDAVHECWAIIDGLKLVLEKTK